MHTKESGQIDTLTGIRGIAALWVACHHLQEYVVRPGNPLQMAGARELARDGWLAVDLFFVLSGFVMMHVHGRDFIEFSLTRAKRFIALRFARIYPAHVVVLMLHVVMLGLIVAFGASYSADRYSLRSLILSLLLLNGWGIPGSEGWNVPSWSVSSEWFAYLLFPLTATLMLRVKNRRTAFVAALVLLAVAPFVWGFLGRVITGFGLGCLAYRFYRTPIGPRVAEAAAELALLFAIVISITSPPGFQFLMLPMFVIAIVGLSQAGGPLGAVMRSGPLVYLGRISYSAYIVHALVLSVYAHAVIARVPAGHGVIVETAVVAGFLAAVVVSAHVLWMTVEEPSRKWLRRVLVDAPVRRPLPHVVREPASIS